MKVTISKFYSEVTGSKTGAKVTTVPALRRWGVPLPDDITALKSKHEIVDIAYLGQAKEAYAREEAERAERAAKRNGRAGAARTGLAHDVAFIKEMLHVQAQAIGRVESLLNRIVASANGKH